MIIGRFMPVPSILDVTAWTVDPSSDPWSVGVVSRRFARSVSKAMMTTHLTGAASICPGKTDPTLDRHNTLQLYT